MFAFVSALYNISDDERYREIVERFLVIANIIPEIHVFCRKADEGLLPPNAIPHFMEFEDLQTYKIISKCTGLPRIRSESKDHYRFMALMNAKPEFMHLLKCSHENTPEEFKPSHYIWLDAGIGKIFKDPFQTLTRFYNYIKPLTLKTDHIFIPGCLDDTKTPFDLQLTRVNWRFCGGFFIVPYNLIDYFYFCCMFACEEIRHRSNRAVWEVNVWNYVEQTTHIPIQWEYGNHNELIFANINKYIKQ